MEILRKKQVEETLSDEEIIELYFARSERAIAETDLKYRKYLLAIAKNILRDDGESEECLGDTYFKTWRTIPPTRPRVFRAFLAKIMRNTAFDRYEEGQRKKRIPDGLCDPLDDYEDFLSGDGLDEELETRRIGEIINEYLSRASDRRMYMFVSRYYFAMPIAEIARRARVSESTVAKELAAAKRELRAALVKGGISL